MRLGANRVSICPVMSATFVLASLLAVAPAWSGEPRDIVPGHAFGPVTLGMPAVRAYAAATRFDRETGCGIDLLIAHGIVIAAGSEWGGCLRLPAAGIATPAIALVQAFGAPPVMHRVSILPNEARQAMVGMALGDANADWGGNGSFVSSDSSSRPSLLLTRGGSATLTVLGMIGLLILILGIISIIAPLRFLRIK